MTSPNLLDINPKILARAGKRAAQLKVSISAYVESLIRHDLDTWDPEHPYELVSAVKRDEIELTKEDPQNPAEHERDKTLLDRAYAKSHGR